MPRNHFSCDQCRRSKRACDAPLLSLPHDLEGGVASLLCKDLQAPLVKPCSYCDKTKKTCTMSWAWSQLKLTAALEAASRGEFGLDSIIPAKRPQAGDGPDHRQHEHLDETPCQPHHHSAHDPGSLFNAEIPSSAAPEVRTSLPTSLPNNFDFGLDVFGGLPEDPSASHLDVNLTSIPPGHPTCYDGLRSSLSPGWGLSQGDHCPSEMELSLSASTDLFDPSPGAAAHTSTLSSYSSLSKDKDKPAAKRLRRTRYPSHPSFSAFSTDQAMISRSNSGFISSNLLRIYHDVLEHNLSCWLTEATCPYKGARGTQEGRRLADWGPSWSNRILDRTVRLDRAAQAAGLVRLTRSEDRAVSRAFHSAIMSFATQWAHGSRRQRERYTGLTNDQDLDELAEEFDRDLQRHFWNQGQRALDEVGHIESYRVACAELIVGICQRPWSQNDDNNAASPRGPFAPFDQASLVSDIEGVMSKDGPPIYTERGVRRVHALKARLDSVMARATKSQQGNNGLPPIQLLSSEDERTVGLLFWLAVMFDTISSSMNERPVSVGDQDSQHDGVPLNEPDLQRWKVDLFIKDKLEAPSIAIHWPCSYEDAAEAVTRSGPVKVLLYRHVSYLQNLLRRGRRGDEVEKVIESTTSLYRYWNVTHGAFFLELVDDFDAVPSRIRSWFFCIAAHWHLAVFMLADLIECVDDENLGLHAASQRRTAAKMVATMRESSVRALSDLARVSLPPDDPRAPFAPTEPQLPEFHEAVSEGAVLTEPWTIIMIRAFARAAVLILKEADSYRRYGLGAGVGGMRDTLHRAEDCVRTLFYLGKKSDMARRVADILSEALAVLSPGTDAGEAAGCAGTWEYDPMQVMV